MIGNKAIAQQLMSRVDIEELGVARALAGGLAEMERAQADAMLELADAHGYDVDVTAPDVDRRRDLLLEGAAAAMDGRGVEWWLETRYGDKMENAAAAAEYIDLEPDAWDDDERAEAAAFIAAEFGVDLEWFERHVIGLDRGAVVRELLAGNLESIEYAIRDAAAQTPEVDDDG